MIANPTKHSAVHKDIIQKLLKDVNFTSEAWADPSIEGIRASIKQHYIVEQQYRCCYCQQELINEHGRAWDVEHVIARSQNPRLMFEPRNLAVACTECNGKKSKVAVTRKVPLRLPTASASYLIVHPHFDRYDEHIEIEGNYTFHALTEKGSFTIHQCQLYRIRARIAGIKKPIRDRRFEQDVGNLRMAKTVNEARPVIAAILERIKIEEEGIDEG
ncbi:HNH endonuclease [Sinorhizobium fredii]|uniref:HNH endonuclease n=1 Tax=Rhizobium fredii TaxID=380 RepID=UPI0006869AD1|nr:HNH endonuclease [Sinorhizobium fredii]AWI57951.1 hypothetical protein AB395_00002298 [Sinorhizobium fredii CCBAU 45436]